MFMIIALTLGLLGALVSLVASIILLVAGFSVHVLWGLTMLLLPGIPQLLFIITHWRKSVLAFQVGLLGFLLSLSGMFSARYAVQSGEVESIGRSLLARLPEDSALYREFGPILQGTNGFFVDSDFSKPLRPSERSPKMDNMVGTRVKKVIERFGHPRAILKTGEFTIMQYEEVELEAGPDGIIRRQYRRVTSAENQDTNR